MKFYKNLNENIEMYSSQKQETEGNDKTILMKEYEDKLYDIAFEMDKLAAHLREKNKQLEEKRELQKETYLFQIKNDEHTNNMSQQLESFKVDTPSPQKYSHIHDSEERGNAPHDDIQDIITLRKENNKLRQMNRQYENEVLTLRNHIEQIQHKFQHYQNDIATEQKTIDQTMVLAKELENLIRVLYSKNNEIKEVKLQNEQLKETCRLQQEREKQRLEREKERLECIIQGNQVEDRYRIENVMKRTTLQTQSSNNNNIQLTQQNKYNEQSNCLEINMRKDQSPLNGGNSGCASKKQNDYYLVTPKSNVTNNQSEYTGRSTNKTDINQILTNDFTRASQFYFTNTQSKSDLTNRSLSPLPTISTPKIINQSTQQFFSNHTSLSPIGKTIPKIVNISSNQKYANQYNK